MNDDLGKRVARIHDAQRVPDFPAWINEGTPPNPRGPTDLQDQIDVFTMRDELASARSEIAQLRHERQRLVALAERLHDDTNCAEPCCHLALLKELDL